MEEPARSPLVRSFERHLRAEKRSDRTVASYLVALRQAEVFLAARGIGLVDAGRADLEAFLGDLLTYRAASTAATYYKVLRVLYRWLDEEDEIDRDPTSKMKRPIVPEQPVPVVPRTACAGSWPPAPARASRTAAIPPSSCSWSTSALAARS